MYSLFHFFFALPVELTPELSHPDDAKHAVTYLFGALSIPGGIGPVLAGEKKFTYFDTDYKFT